ncbi:hypothetical protein DICPUDRAFT_29615 [Dictyostelium purpureum]|uniref:FAD-binding domain-containing protein n=1 Tax=Dictyostelium purpureum TaxID=5786 RepID=F0ZDW7_DICPU|nr:uncharacterized protein DICPUDRAFT_29615 [Dictyostelium purpureum]EGC37853.1 hypothetical protein DICPUDRAFT_29615 [Dictyostelium purpureum]|eukprot:XP_003285603.1 hypothetical protein DICPUDRAFT_29615 [Dictyostelium purpureum]
MTRIEELKIGIVGGGPSGLAITRMLQQNGFLNIKIYERDKNRSCRPQGASIDLCKHLGQKLIKEAGLKKEFSLKSRPEGECYTFMDTQGNVKARRPFLKINSTRPEIDRGDLRDILLDSLFENTIEWDCHFKNLNKLDNGQVELVFNDGEKKEIVDFVIGCDGVNSKVRGYITDIKPLYLGITMIEGEIIDPINTCPQMYELVHQGLSFTLADGIVFLGQQKTDGNMLITIAQMVPEDWIKTKGFDFKSLDRMQEIKDYIKKELIPNWDPMYHKLVDDCSGLYKPRLLLQAPLDQKWESKSNLTIIGDAAHAISPFAGLGCNIALYDSLKLGRLLIKNKNKISTPIVLQGIISSFEKEMISFWKPLALITMSNEQMVFKADTKTLLKKRFGNLYFTKNYLQSIFNFVNNFTDFLKITS